MDLYTLSGYVQQLYIMFILLDFNIEYENISLKAQHKL